MYIKKNKIGIEWYNLLEYLWFFIFVIVLIIDEKLCSVYWNVNIDKFLKVSW